MDDSLQTLGASRDAVIDCGFHGKQTVKSIFFGGEWKTTSCKICLEEHRQHIQLEEKQADAKWREDAPQRKIARELGRSGIPDRHSKCQLGTYIPQHAMSEVILNFCKTYAEKFPQLSKQGTSLIFCGNAGTGKTHLTCAIANHIIKHHGKTALFITAVKAIRHIKQTYSKLAKLTEQEAINWFLTPDLLILDEVGVQFGSETEKNILFEILNERYEAMKPTILISNLSLENLAVFTGERVIDRMKENGGNVLKFTWDSHRGKTN